MTPEAIALHMPFVKKGAALLDAWANNPNNIYGIQIHRDWRTRVPQSVARFHMNDSSRDIIQHASASDRVIDVYNLLNLRDMDNGDRFFDTDILRAHGLWGLSSTDPNWDDLTRCWLLYLHNATHPTHAN